MRRTPKRAALTQRQTPELMISIRYGKILRSKALSIPDLGVLNLHSGKLPDYRGVMATFRAMLAQEQELFSTLHWIDDDTIDTGRVISVGTQACCHRLLFIQHPQSSTPLAAGLSSTPSML